MVSCVSSAARLCEAIGTRHDYTGTLGATPSESKATIKEIVSSWEGELESFFAHESNVTANMLQ
jgi:hypothetical protein